MREFYGNGKKHACRSVHERSLWRGLYNVGPLLACPYWSSCTLVAFVGGEGKQKRLSGPLFGAGPISGCTNVPFSFGYSLLVFEHLGCWGRVAMYKQVALLLRLSLLTLSIHCSENSVPLTQLGSELGEPVQPGNPAPELAP